MVPPSTPLWTYMRSLTVATTMPSASISYFVAPATSFHVNVTEVSSGTAFSVVGTFNWVEAVTISLQLPMPAAFFARMRKVWSVLAKRPLFV
ncbi:hypothetical protein D3C76_1521850 [compost metagenome]